MIPKWRVKVTSLKNGTRWITAGGETDLSAIVDTHTRFPDCRIVEISWSCKLRQKSKGSNEHEISA